MKFIRLINYLALFVAVLTVPLLADEDVLRPHGRPDGGGRDNLPVYIGIEGGLNFNMYNSNFLWIDEQITGVPVPTLYENVKSGSGISPHVGIFVDFSFTKSIGVQLRLSYDKKYFGNSGSGIDYNYSFNNMPVQATIDWNVTADFFTITPLFRYNFTENFLMTVGPTFQYLTSDVVQKFDANTGGNVDPQFLKWYLAMNSAFGPDFQVKERYGIEVGFGYKYPIAKKVFIVPQGRIQIMLSPMFEKVYLFDPGSDPSTIDDITTAELSERSLYSIQLALALMFEL